MSPASDLMPEPSLSAGPEPIDLLVIGAGTSGRHAAIAAAEAGLVVHLVGTQPDTRRGRDADSVDGVRHWFEHSALALLRDGAGRVCGARGVAGPDEQPWRQAARAVVLATGRAPVGLLLASEAGAELQPVAEDGATDGRRPDWLVATDDAAGATGVPGLWVTGRVAGAPQALGLLPPDSLAAQLLAARRTGLAAAAWIDDLQSQPVHTVAAPRAGEPAADGQAIALPRTRQTAPVLDPRAARQTLAAVLGTLALARPGDLQALRTGRQQLDALWQFLSLAGDAPLGFRRSARDVLARVDLARRALNWQIRGQMDGTAAAPAPASTSSLAAAAPRWNVLQAFAR